MSSLLFFTVFAQLSCGLLILYIAKNRANSERVLHRLNLENSLHDTGPEKIGRIDRILIRSGVSMSKGQCKGLLALVLLMCSVVFLRSGMQAMLALLLGAGVALQLYLRWRYYKRVNQMVSQLPMFLDHMIRSLKSGRNVSDAMLLATQRSESPLKEALSSCTRGMNLGLTMSEVMTDFATLYDRREFYILAATIKVNQHYGGNASQLMESLIVMIRDQERASAQLRALTGESRVSAWILGAMPILMGGYIFFANPDFFMGLWNHETGRSLLYTAIGLQFGGVFLLWRMMRSI